MRTTSRRSFVKALAFVSGSYALAQNANAATKNAGRSSWPYVELDASLAAEAAYNGYRRMESCMYGVFASVVDQLAAKVGDPYKSFPSEMMVYGEGGVAGWGSLCGALNGGAAAISLLVRDTADRKALIDSLFNWYQNTEIPSYKPSDGSAGQMDIPAVEPKSILCHGSCAAWLKKSKVSFYSKERKERCARVSADVARKTVELLNSEFAGVSPEAVKLDERTQGCLSCHGKDGAQRNVLAKSCHGCHFPETNKHP